MQTTPKKLNIKNNFIPETKTIAAQDKTNRIVWPTSGWFKRITQGIIKHKKLKKYEVCVVKKFSLDKIFAIITIKKGFKNSIGWNLKKNKFSHLLEPFTSTPKNSTKNNVTNSTKNIGIKIFFKKFNLRQEMEIIKKIEEIENIKCLEKKK